MMEPAEHGHRNAKALRRLQTGVASLMVAAVTLLWILGTGPHGYGQYSENLPASGGAPAVILVLALLGLNGLFVAAEAAIELLRPVHVKHVREEENKRAERLQVLIDDRGRFSAACIFGSHLCRVGMVLSGFLLAPGVAHLIAPDNPNDFRNLVLAAALVSIPILLLNLIFEVVPKSFASLHPHRIGLRLYRFITVFSIFLSPPAALVRGLGGLITNRFGARASFTIENQAEEEIKSLVEDAQESGEIEEDEKELLHSVFEFTDTIAREVMTPRVDMDSMPANSPPDEVVKVIQETGHSRIPLYEETDDQIVGIVHAKDLLMAMSGNKKPENLKKLMRPALFVPEGKNLHELLGEMRAGKTQMAIVQDEFGGTAGVVTIEDIVEELVGDIMDEYDVEEPQIVRDDGGYVVDGKTHVDDVNDELGSELSSEEFDTIGGYVFGLFGRQPRIAESICADGLCFTVIETDGRRILKLRVERKPLTEDDLLSEEEA